MKQSPSHETHDSHDINRHTNRYFLIFLLLPMLVGLIYFIAPQATNSNPSSQPPSTPSIGEDYFSDFVETDVFPLNELILFLGEEAQPSMIVPFEDSSQFYYRIHQTQGPSSFQIIAQLESQYHLDASRKTYQDLIEDDYYLVQQISVEPFEALYVDDTEMIRLNLFDFNLNDHNFYLRFIFQLNH